MAEANDESLPTQAARPLPPSTEIPRQINRGALEKTRKSELQQLGRDIGLNNIWVRKDQLINKILEKLQPDTALNAAHTSVTALTSQADTARSLRQDTAPLPPPDQAPLPLLDKAQSALDDSSHSLSSDVDSEQRPGNTPLQLPDNMENIPPLRHNTAQLLTTHDNEQPINHDAAQPLHTNTVQQKSQAPSRPPCTDATPSLRDDHSQQHPANNSQSTNSAPDVQGDKTEIDIHTIAREMKNITDKFAMKDLEIELLSEEVKTAYQIIAALQQRVTMLEQRNTSSDEEQRQPLADNKPMPHCLLLGDSNLCRVLSSDLGDNCSVKTINGANIDSIRRWIPEQFHKTPTECVLYCGINDILDESPHENVLDNIGALVSELKEKNCNMKVYVCQIVPPSVLLDSKENIESFNEHLLKWGETNGIVVLKTTPKFKLSTGELDDLCFEGDANNAVLSRIGIIRLLDTVANQCSEFKLCKNWKQVKISSVNLAKTKLDKIPPGEAQQSIRRAPTQPLSVPASRPPAGPLFPPRSVGREAATPPPPPTSGLAGSGVAPLFLSYPAGHGAAPLLPTGPAGPRAPSLYPPYPAGNGVTPQPSQSPACPGAAPIYLPNPAGHDIAPRSSHGPAVVGAASLHNPPYPADRGGAPPPPPPPSVALPGDALHPSPYVVAPAAAQYHRSNEEISGSALFPYAHVGGTGSAMHYLPREATPRAAPQGGARVWGSNATRHPPPGQESRRTAAHYPPSSEGHRHAWRHRGAFRGAPPALRTVQRDRQVPASVEYYTTTQKGTRRGCYNCGEFNHHKESCRFDHLLRCGFCHQLGHKQRLCQYYST